MPSTVRAVQLMRIPTSARWPRIERYGALMSELARDAHVDGRWIAGPRRFAVHDPFDGALIAEVADSDEHLVDAAVAAAASAFGAWRARTGPERGGVLRQLAARMLADEARLAQLCTRENGKALKESVAEVRYAASFLSWFAG